MRAHLTTGEVKGIIRHQKTSGELGSFITTIITKDTQNDQQHDQVLQLLYVLHVIDSRADSGEHRRKSR